MSRLSPRGWAVLATLVSVGAAAAVLLDAASPLRAVLVLGFLLLMPGMALVRLLDLDELAVQIALGSGLSISLASIVAGTLLYAGAWSPAAGFAILVGVTLAAVAVELERAERRARSARRRAYPSLEVVGAMPAAVAVELDRARSGERSGGPKS